MAGPVETTRQRDAPAGTAAQETTAGRTTDGGETSPLREVAEEGDSFLFSGVGSERRLRRWAVWAIQAVLLTVFFLGWERLVEARVADPFFFSQPSRIARQLWEWFAGGSVYRHIGITLLETLLGFFGGTLLGLVIGFVLARSETLGDIFEPFLALLNGMPRVVLAPLVILWLGLGIASKVALSVLVVFLIVFYAVYTGIREVDQNLVANARVLGANGRQLTWHVLIPSALTWIFSSLRVSVGFALVGAVVAEYLGSNMGVGFLIANAQSFFQSTGVYAGLTVLMLMVGAINLLLRAVERRFSAWKAG
jgi:NitT/TauT family transport system permease protein